MNFKPECPEAVFVERSRQQRPSSCNRPGASKSNCPLPGPSQSGVLEGGLSAWPFLQPCPVPGNLCLAFPLTLGSHMTCSDQRESKSQHTSRGWIWNFPLGLVLRFLGHCHVNRPRSWMSCEPDCTAQSFRQRPAWVSQEPRVPGPSGCLADARLTRLVSKLRRISQPSPMAGTASSARGRWWSRAAGSGGSSTAFWHRRLGLWAH